jgi:hypothetical protein
MKRLTNKQDDFINDERVNDKEVKRYVEMRNLFIKEVSRMVKMLDKQEEKIK